MPYCKNTECEYNEDGCYCEYEDSITIDENGVCESNRLKSISTIEEGKK